MKSSSKNNSLIFILGTLVVLVLLNLISQQGFFRLDLTRDGKYTLSQASIETVNGLSDLMTVSAYFTADLPPPYAQHSRYVNDLLEEYLAKANGKFAFEFLDPTRSETEEDKEKKKNMQRDIFGRMMRESTTVEKELSDVGIQPVEIRVIENDQQQSKRAYMGIVIRYQDKHEVIPVVQNLADLEKDMTSLMRKLVRPHMPVAGLVHDSAASNIGKLRQTLSQNIELKDVNLNTDSAIADDIEALLVIGSGDHFGDNGAKKIHDFLAKGKSAAFMLDRFSIDPRSFQQMPVGPRSKTHYVFDLLKEYGVEIEENLIADASCASLNVQEQRGQFSFSMPVKYPFVPELMNLSFESPITKGLSGVILPFISKLNITEKAGLKNHVLAQSSKISWVEKEPLNLDPRRNWGEEDIKPNGPHPLLVELRGALPNTPAATDDKKPLDTRVVVIGSSAFVRDEFMNQSNQVLALNIVDWMLADAALLEMRARSFADAPLDVDISDRTRQAVKLGNILGVPFLLVLYGLIRWRMRESRRHSLKSA